MHLRQDLANSALDSVFVAVLTLQLFRSQAQQLDAAARDVAVLGELGVPFELLSRDELARAEPGGSGRLIADLVTGRTPDIDPDGLGIERYCPAARPRWQPRLAT